jgi:uncharacterized protein DUF2690
MTVNSRTFSWMLGAALAWGLAVAPASAQTCSGADCTGQTPQATGCDADGIWVTAAPANVGFSAIGYVHLMWSPTCQTVWSRLSTFGPQSGAYWAFLSSGLNFAYQIGAPYEATYDFTQVFDPSLQQHKDSLMYHRSDNRVSNGVRACGRITGVFNLACTVLVDPDEL